jgi:RNA polymerase sigma-70 factor, ECF subfamily
MPDPDWLAEHFEANRPHLRAVAYRMLGSSAEAEDAVQDAWLRASRAGTDDVENLGGWLTTIVARLCLDRLRARAARREEPLGADENGPDGGSRGPLIRSVIPLDGPATGLSSSGDPEAQAVLADAIGLAMVVVLDRLAPAERIAFVLHDTFGLPFDQIAPIVERTPTATRQLASRARRRVRGATGAGVAASMARQRELVDAFLTAARNGDFEALLRVLDPDVVVRADTAATAGPFVGRVETRGARAVAAQALLFQSLAGGARAALVNDAPGLVVYRGTERFAVLGFQFAGDRITALDIELGVDPARG